MAKVRNQTAAHYNADFQIYYPIIEKLDKRESIETIEEFLFFLMSVIKLIEGITSKLTKEIY